MKKSTAAILGALILVGGGLYFAASNLLGVSAGSIAVIGGADGPTAVFIAGKDAVGGGVNLILPVLVAGVALIGLGTWIYNKKHK